MTRAIALLAFLCLVACIAAATAHMAARVAMVSRDAPTVWAQQTMVTESMVRMREGD